MLRETAFKFKVLAVESFDYGIINPELLKVSAYSAGGVPGSGLDAPTIAAFEKVLPGDIGMIDGKPAFEAFDGGLWGF